ncbi:MAG: hypothetical protein M1817_006606 [Caeruleum heppii]|nr:MAG: hypothetical protein M1817_006606 [Caeruleum heppii]
MAHPHHHHHPHHHPPPPQAPYPPYHPATGLPPSAFQIQVKVPPLPTPQQQYHNYAAYHSNYAPLPPLQPQPPHQYHDRLQIVPPPIKQSYQYQPVAPPPLTPVVAPSVPLSHSYDAPAVDHHVLLLSLAEEYLAAAHAQGSTVALTRSGTESDRYHSLVATGLGCLEAVLKTYRLPPRTEAAVRLRYASVLNEETDNTMEAETALSKGITICERNRLLDMKYNMQHLMARVIARSNSKAGLKFLDGVIHDVEAYQHISWLYAFRLLRVSLSLESSTSTDLLSALQNLKSISATASSNGDNAMFGMASLLEALIHLRSGTADFIEQTQRAIAAARSLQWTDAIARLPQLDAFTHLLDLSCGLMEGNTQHTDQKLRALRTLMDQAPEDPYFGPDGTFSIPVRRGSALNTSVPMIGGIVTSEGDGTDLVHFSWMPSRDVYTLGYLLSGITTSHRNTQSGYKSEKYLTEGLRMARENAHDPDAESQSLAYATSRLEWRSTVRCYMRVHLAFAYCARTEWQLGRTSLERLQYDTERPSTTGSDALKLLVLYLRGVIHQGTGNVDGALSVFQDPALALPGPGPRSGGSSHSLQRNLAILACLNSILLLRNSSSRHPGSIEGLLSAVEPLCLTHPHLDIRSAFSLIKAASHPTDPMIKKKGYIQNGLSGAQLAGNVQLTCLALIIVSWKFFRGVVGEQAEKSAKAALNQASKAEDRLWMCVAQEMKADCYEVQGKMEESRGMREEAQRLAAQLAPVLRRSERETADVVMSGGMTETI